VRAADLDDDLAWELAVPATTRRSSMVASRLASAFRNGVLAGLVPSAIVLGTYFFQHHEADLPWVKIASILAVYGPGVGVLLAVFCEALMIATDRIARVGFGLVAIANPITACALGGLLSGIAPGAIGVLVFGSYRGPFVGTSLIAFGLIAGAVMVAVPLAVRARRLREARKNPWIIGGATLIATAILCGVAAIIAPVIVGTAFDAAREGVTVDEYGGLIGAVGGAVGGGVSGVFIGIVVIVARGRLRASASPTVTAARRT
jgi:hypothetical protein